MRPHGPQPTRVICPWDFPNKNTRVGCHFLLQGIFLTWGSNMCLLHWQADSLPLSHQRSPHTKVWGAFTLSLKEITVLRGGCWHDCTPLKRRFTVPINVMVSASEEDQRICLKRVEIPMRLKNVTRKAVTCRRVHGERCLKSRGPGGRFDS